MSDLTNAQVDAALHALVNDVKHLLDYLTLALTCLALYFAITAIQNGSRHDWWGTAFGALFALSVGGSAFGTFRRARKYEEATA